MAVSSVTQQAYKPGAVQLSMVLVQASSRSWVGGHDCSVSLVENVPTFIHTLKALQAALPDTPYTVIAPQYDQDGSLETWLKDQPIANTQVTYGYDDSPLNRMVAAVSDLPDDAYVLRINGLNLFVDARIITDMLSKLALKPGVDCYKMPDDYPAALSFDIYRVGALRKALELLPDTNLYHVHVKYFMVTNPKQFEVLNYTSRLNYSEDEMWSFKKRLTSIHQVEHTDVQEQYALSSGDQLQLHYELALQKMRAGSTVLDIGCGSGFGGAYMAQNGQHVLCGDLDETSLLGAQNRYADVPHLRFELMNAEATPLDDSSLDYITSFETIEHIEDIPAYLSEFSRILKPGGLVFFSTPQNSFGKVPLNHYHRREYSYEELKNMIETTFDIVEFIGIKQGRIYFPKDPIGNNSFVIARSRK